MKKLEDILQLLGINLKQGKWKVLSVILSAQEELGAGITFNVLKKGLEATEGKKVARPLIYRYLKELEENGMLYIDRTSRTNLYVIDEETVIQSLRTSRAIKVSELKKDLRTITAKGDILAVVSSDRLTEGFVETLTGKKSEDTTKVGTDLGDVRKLIHDKIFSRARANDFVRFSLDYDTLDAILDEDFILTGVKLAAKRIKFQVLISQAKNQILEGRIRSSPYLKVRSGEELRIEYRISTRTTKTHQCVTLNADGIVLLVSVNPLSAIWIPRSQNKLLVEDVISRFDQDYSEAVPMEM